MSAEWISLKQVAFVRNRRRILDGIDWEIRPGNHWVVLGANGSGKTTLLQILAGYLWPTEGTITVLGERFGHTDLRQLRKKIGWVGSFLEMQIPSDQKPLDLIVSGKFASIGIFETPSREDYEVARHVASMLGCERILHSPYGVLSQGEKQRLLIARALVHHPRLLILDEPCSGLDLAAREDLLRTLDEMGRADDAPTMILVTHHLEEITPVFSRVLLLKEGRCVEKGAKEALLSSEVLDAVFGIPLDIHQARGRYWAGMRFDGDSPRSAPGFRRKGMGSKVDDEGGEEGVFGYVLR
ncbi:MAG: ABC transporter ATP-binding protein [Syntrophobacteraceae bacterium]|nr:ABC transporter ATP-binding protein [Syntrophobacteraceae bacterium]